MIGDSGGWFWRMTAAAVLLPPCVCDLGMRKSCSPGSVSSTSTFAPEPNGHVQRRLVHGWAAEDGQRCTSDESPGDLLIDAKSRQIPPINSRQIPPIKSRQIPPVNSRQIPPINLRQTVAHVTAHTPAGSSDMMDTDSEEGG